VSAAFDLTGNSLLPATAPQYSSSGAVHGIPPSLLKAVGWVESGWRQFDSTGKPLVAPDFGYGIMQITSGMPGAFGNVRGSIPPASQSSVASDYVFNIAYGAKMLVDKWNSTPRIGNGDPSILENWYFALWAYNGWGWVNNPNNPRFSRVGTPAQNPSTFPYQERVLYLVQHPPSDGAGNPRWKPLAISLPANSVIGNSPQSFTPKSVHSQPVQALDAVYKSSPRLSALPNSIVSVPVRVENTGTLPWPSTGTLAISLTYHLMTPDGNPWIVISPFSKGVISFAQAQTVLPTDVLPGKSVSVHISVHMPASPGSFRLVWDLQQGASTLFSQQGVLPLTAQLHVGTNPTATPTPRATPTPAVTKLEDAQYVRDTSVPDGTVLSPSQTFDKGWLLFNDGKSAWGTGWSLRHVSGNIFGLRTAPVPVTSPCRSLNFVATLHAPKKAGAYRGVWRLYDSHNTAVGDRLTVVVTVRGTPGSATPTPLPVPSPTAPGHTAPTPTATPVG
jgi:Ig-like domain from next to BRCA1 gene/Transglycosylase SLT domain